MMRVLGIERDLLGEVHQIAKHFFPFLNLLQRFWNLMHGWNLTTAKHHSKIHRYDREQTTS